MSSSPKTSGKILSTRTFARFWEPLQGMEADQIWNELVYCAFEVGHTSSRDVFNRERWDEVMKLFSFWNRMLTSQPLQLTAEIKKYCFAIKTHCFDVQNRCIECVGEQTEDGIGKQVPNIQWELRQSQKVREHLTRTIAKILQWIHPCWLIIHNSDIIIKETYQFSVSNRIRRWVVGEVRTISVVIPQMNTRKKQL